jgi:EAL domain-containing protein (putative c-di-GMP-specific phosphodiesterase class I)
LPENSQTLNFVARLNHQAQERGIELIAEHIENEGALETVRKIGITYVQDFILANPSRRAIAKSLTL